MRTAIFSSEAGGVARTKNQLTDLLALRVMGWGTGPSRYLLSTRSWLPKWRFQPTKIIADAFKLLEALAAVEYALRADRKGLYRATVRTTDRSGEASGSSLPCVICLAIARAYCIRVEGLE